jgi:DUF1365 family protein
MLQIARKQLLLVAQQVGKRLDLSAKNLFFEFLTHPLMSFKVILAIHFEAFRLWFKGIKHVKKKIKIKSLEQQNENMNQNNKNLHNEIEDITYRENIVKNT